MRDHEDAAAVSYTVSSSYVKLKHIFTNLMSEDHYPHIGWNDFANFCRVVGILDHTIPTSTIDRMFIATKVGSP